MTYTKSQELNSPIRTRKYPFPTGKVALALANALLSIGVGAVVVGQEAISEVASSKPTWRVDKPFGEAVTATHFRHNYVLTMDFVFPNGWEASRLSPDAEAAIRSIDHSEPLTHDTVIPHSQVQGGAFLVGRDKHQKSSVSLTVFLERIPAESSDDDFVDDDQKVRYYQTLEETLKPEVDRAVAKSHAWIAGRSCRVVDIDGIYRRGGLKERYYYIPTLPQAYVDAKKLEHPRYMYVLRFRANSYAARERLALSVPSMVRMAGPLLSDGYMTEEDVTAQNLVFKALNEGANLVSNAPMNRLLDSCVRMDFLFETTMDYVADASSGGVGLFGSASRRGANAAVGQAWTDLKKGVEEQAILRELMHDQLALAAWDAITPSDQLMLEQYRPDFIAAINAARGRIAQSALIGIAN